MSACALLAILCSASAMAQSGVYRDQNLHFSLHYPAGLQVNAAVQQQIIPQARDKVRGDPEASKAMACLQIQLVAVENPRTTTFRMLVITRLDLDCRNQSTKGLKLDDLTEGALRSAMTMLGSPVIRKVSSYRVAEHLASVVEGDIDPQVSKSNVPLFGETACALIDHDVVCFSAMATDRVRVREVLEGEITFDGGREQPLVQAALLAP